MDNVRELLNVAMGDVEVLPILADALEEDGFDVPEILAALRADPKSPLAKFLVINLFYNEDQYPVGFFEKITVKSRFVDLQKCLADNWQWFAKNITLLRVADVNQSNLRYRTNAMAWALFRLQRYYEIR